MAALVPWRRSWRRSRGGERQPAGGRCRPGKTSDHGLLLCPLGVLDAWWIQHPANNCQKPCSKDRTHDNTKGRELKNSAIDPGQCCRTSMDMEHRHGRCAADGQHHAFVPSAWDADPAAGPRNLPGLESLRISGLRPIRLASEPVLRYNGGVQLNGEEDRFYGQGHYH